MFYRTTKKTSIKRFIPKLLKFASILIAVYPREFEFVPLSGPQWRVSLPVESCHHANNLFPNKPFYNHISVRSHHLKKNDLLSPMPGFWKYIDKFLIHQINNLTKVRCYHFCFDENLSNLFKYL